MPQNTAMTDGIRNLIFDFGGVLLDIDIRRTVAAFAALGLPGLDPFDTHPRNAGVFLRLELGQITERQFVEQLQALVPDGNPVPAPAQLLDAWNAMLLPYDWRRFELLDRLRAEGRRIFLLSNTNLPHISGGAGWCCRAGICAVLRPAGRRAVRTAPTRKAAAWRSRPG